jgi:hypothetical protein
MIRVANERHVYGVRRQINAPVGAKHTRHVADFVILRFEVDVFEKTGRNIDGINPTRFTDSRREHSAVESGSGTNVSNGVTGLDRAGIQNLFTTRVDFAAFNLEPTEPFGNIECRVKNTIIDARF